MSNFERAQFDNSISGGGFSSREQLPKSETLITPGTLYQDNRSPKAHSNVTDWDINRLDGLHIVTATCADARIEVPMDTNTERIHTIAVGGPKNPYENLFKGRNIRAAVALAHHDGDTITPGRMPTGCGGLGAKAEIKANGKRKNMGVEQYVDRDVYHEDAILQACVSALEIAGLTDKPVLAATQDHLTGEIHPLLAFWSNNSTRFTACNRSVSIKDLLDPVKYAPAKIYQEGLPCLATKDLPEELQEYMAANQREVDLLHENHPDFRQMQKIQNPETVILTTDIRPTRLKYPTLFEKPGSFFRLTIPRIKNSQGEEYTGIEFSQEELQRVFEQVQYPIEHFSKVKNIVIETPSLEWSNKIGRALTEEGFMEKWVERLGSQILALETRGGKIYNPTRLNLHS